jgi:hypothetical protein
MTTNYEVCSLEITSAQLSGCFHGAGFTIGAYHCKNISRKWLDSYIVALEQNILLGRGPMSTMMIPTSLKDGPYGRRYFRSSSKESVLFLRSVRNGQDGQRRAS